MKRRPIDYVEYEKDHRKRYQHCHVHGTRLVLLHGGRHLPEGLDFHLQQNDGILKKCAKHEEDAANHP